MSGGASRIRAGDLNRLVSVQQRSQTHDAYGAQSITWTEIKQVWAAIDGLYAREVLAMKGTAAEVTHSITVRYDAIWADPKVAAQYRLVARGRIFEISGVTIENDRDSVVTLLAAEGASDATSGVTHLPSFLREDGTYMLREDGGRILRE